MPFTRDERTALLAGCGRYSDWRGRAGQENACRLRAFILLARYSGLRVGDVASCAVDRLSGTRLFLYTQKTGVPVYVPLPPFVVEALEACPLISERYWFWTGVGSKETLAGNWRRTFRRLCKIAGVLGGHPHRFRDTLAVELLLDGMPIERVSILLGTRRYGHRTALLSLGEGASGATQSGLGARLGERSHRSGGNASRRRGLIW